MLRFKRETPENSVLSQHSVLLTKFSNLHNYNLHNSSMMFPRCFPMCSILFHKHTNKTFSHSSNVVTNFSQVGNSQGLRLVFYSQLNLSTQQIFNSKKCSKLILVSSRYFKEFFELLYRNTNFKKVHHFYELLLDDSNIALLLTYRLTVSFTRCEV